MRSKGDKDMIKIKTRIGMVMTAANEKELLENNLNNILGGYENGMCDEPDDFPKLTKEQVIDYCIPEIYNQFSDGSGCTVYGRGISDCIKFLGNDYIYNKIIEIAKECDILEDEGMKVEIEFDRDWIRYLKTKFDFNTKDDLREVIFECVSTYMEM